MPNRLTQETSPYLLQHADNPVDWYPWGKEALEKAARENKPIFLRIGYSACHWCHVMERESFSDPDIADVLRQGFVSVKVDREERPDLDSVYMDAVNALTGRGGWPLSVWLTPTGAPFFGGTYFPDKPRFGMPSFRQVLEAIAEAWNERREDLEETARGMVDLLAGQDLSAKTERPLGRPAPVATTPRAGMIESEWVERTLRTLGDSFDWGNGGWNGAPKFPQPLPLGFLLAAYALAPRPEVLRQFELALDSMAAGGIYDHLGGGFHRYSTDERWLIPHFEKMLYDNALLAGCYLRGWQLTKKPRYREVLQETLDYVLREMTSPEGGFFSSEDADSEGEEGKFFVWSAEEVDEILGADSELFRRIYGVTASGNFEGRSVLSVVRPTEDRREVEVLALARARLRSVRDRRVRPARDEKVLASWNGLMLAAFAEAARPLRSSRYLQAAKRSGDFLLREMTLSDHRLVRSWRSGAKGGNAFLEDYADVCHGLLALYQATFDERWFVAARSLADTMIQHFHDPAGGFFDTGDDHEALITRPRAMQDNVLPSGNSMAARVLLQLAALTGEGHYWDLAWETIGSARPLFDRVPLGFGSWLFAELMATRGPREVAVVGDMGAAATNDLIDVVLGAFRPDVVIAGRGPGRPSSVPLLAERELSPGSQPTAWLCAGASCSAPMTDPGALRAALETA